MPVNVRPQSRANPLSIGDEEYKDHIQRAEGGWSRCASETEWLAKLHYLREGYRAGKLDAAQFEEREFRLVQSYLNRLI